MSPGTIAGDVDDGYGKLADVSAAIMISGQEIVKVVDLWGGYRNGITTGPWRDDTLVTMFPPRKVCRRWRSQSPLLRVSSLTTRNWPTTRQADRGAVTVRQLLSHQAGLPARQARLLATHGGPGAWCPSTSRRHALGRPITRPKNRD